MHSLPRLGSLLPMFIICWSMLSVGQSTSLWAEQSTESVSADADSSDSSTEKQSNGDQVSATGSSSGKSSSGNGNGNGSSDSKSKHPPYDEVLEDAESIDGMIQLHLKEDRLYAELRPSQLNKDFICLITIARGIGQGPIFGGFSWGFGDDWVWQFRKAGERIHLVRRNVRFTADRSSPTAKAVEFAYTDSVLFSLPVTTRGPGSSYVVDLTPVFMSDLPQISMVMPGFSFSSRKSTWADVKGFPKNIELQVAATYASSGSRDIESVADSRGVTINVHYSISELPKTSYEPRLADDRVGYFVTVLKDFSKKDANDRFVRYINRWNLEKSDPAADFSPPKEPIVFYLERTIPFKYRKPIRDGILEWNKAFEKAGFYDALEVRQQHDDATWEPGDIRYNTFRWITSGAGFAMGPSRVNPTTGQILDADIIFDADFLQFWKQEYETFTPDGIALLTGGPLDLDEYRTEMNRLPEMMRSDHGARCSCQLMSNIASQFALGSAVMATRQQSPEDLDKLIMQGIKEIAMHEVGHTLGLRHNFKASVLYSLADANDVTKTSETGIGASVMDYNPVNIVPEGMTQGDYYSTTIGPYDMWAIEYGYTPISGNGDAEIEELNKIASRSGEKGLAYSPDEDSRGIDPDPHSTQWDLGDDTIVYAKSQAKLIAESWPGIVDNMTDDGESYEVARRAFGVLLARHGMAMYGASRYIGGIYVSRSHKGDENAPAPYEIVSADKQREALDLLEEQVFSDEPFNFPPDLYNHLASTKWDHWGMHSTYRSDYPAHEAILLWQNRILSRLLSSLTLARMYDSELKVPANQDALTAAEMIDTLTKAIFSELDSIDEEEFTNRLPAISSLRRNLQRAYLERLSYLAIGYTSAPADCASVAFAQLMRLQTRIDNVLDSDVELDDYTQAHLQEASARITKVLDAKMLLLP